MCYPLILALIGGLASLALCLYFWKKGQFEDCEDTKYQMFRDDTE